MARERGVCAPCGGSGRVWKDFLLGHPRFKVCESCSGTGLSALLDQQKEQG